MRGINTKFCFLVTSPEIFNYDFLIFFDTWLKPQVHSAEFFYVNLFNVYRDDRLERSGGGVLIAAKLRIVTGSIDVSSIISVVPKINILAIKAIIDDMPFILIATYIPPYTTVQEIESFFEAT